jgi:hypothetical protein
MLLGKTVAPPLPWPPAENDTGPKELFKLALGWLKEDKVVRKEREKVTGRIRGPKAEVSLASSSILCTRYLLSETITSCLYLLSSSSSHPFTCQDPLHTITLTLVVGADDRPPTQRPSLRNTITRIDRLSCKMDSDTDLELE